MNTNYSNIFSLAYLIQQLQKCESTFRDGIVLGLETHTELKICQHCVIRCLWVCHSSPWTPQTSIFTAWRLAGSNLGPFQHLLTSVHVRPSLLTYYWQSLLPDVGFKARAWPIYQSDNLSLSRTSSVSALMFADMHLHETLIFQSKQYRKYMHVCLYFRFKHFCLFSSFKFYIFGCIWFFFIVIYIKVMV